MNRIDKKFKDLKKEGKKAFVAFITCGFPNLKTTENLLKEFARIGVDVIELGIPFSDPMADGKVIQEASLHALKNKVTLKNAIDLVARVRKDVNVPIAFMTYYNPVYKYGLEKFVNDAVKAGVDGVIIPDLPPEEAKDLKSFSDNKNFDIISFLAPTSTDARIKFVSKQAKGFIYYVSLTGVTGERTSLAKNIQENLKRIYKFTDKPVCVGFGVSNAAQVKDIQKCADGVIVGSAIVKKIKENIGKADLVVKVSQYVEELKG